MKIKGFSLVELLIVLFIIGLLSAVSIPLYSQHLIKERRITAAITLSRLSIALEEYFLAHHSYKDATITNLGFTEIIDRYQLALNASDDGSYLIQAIPLAEQAQKDPLCGTLTLNSQGIKGITGNGKITDCW